MSTEREVGNGQRPVAETPRIKTMSDKEALERLKAEQFTTYPDNGQSVSWQEMAEEYHSRWKAAEAQLSALEKAARFAASQLDAMVCADCEQHAVYPDPDEPANRLRALLPPVPEEGS